MPDPQIPVLRSNSIRSWPTHADGGQALYLPLSAALTQRWDTDAHLQACSLPSLPRRLSSAALGHPDLPAAPAMVVATFDLDGPSHKGTDAFWDDTIARVDRLRIDHPAPYTYRTRGGARLLYTLPDPLPLPDPQSGDEWRRTYLAWTYYLERRYGIIADRACASWCWLFRLPHATRSSADPDAPAQPEELATYGDPSAIGTWAPELSEADWQRADEYLSDAAPPQRPSRAKTATHNGHAPPPPGTFVLHSLLSGRGAVGRELSSGAIAVACPWGHEHTSGKDLDSSTVIFPPTSGDSLGAFRCLHQHCALRSAADVLALFSDDEIDIANGRTPRSQRRPRPPLPDRPPDWLHEAEAEWELDPPPEESDRNRITLEPPDPDPTPGQDPAAQILALLSDDTERAYRDPVLSIAARLRRQSPGDYERLVLTLKQQHGDTIRIGRWESVVGQHLRESTATARAKQPWHSQLIRSPEGNVRPALVNAVTALSEDPRWHGVLAWNEHSHQVEWHRDPPWPAADAAQTPRGVWREHEDHLLVCLLERELQMSIRPSQARAAVTTVARRNPYHPVRQYLESLTWDGVPRVDRWLATYLGCTSQDPTYLRDVGRWVLIGAVVRAFRPGAKVDNVMVLEGGQGARKSTAVSVLGGPFCVEVDAAILGTTDKDTLLSCRLAWIVEAGEFDSLRDASMARLKNIVSRPVDTFRAPYGQDAQKVPRGWICIGTTNADVYLRDSTGARRFWPVRVGEIDIGALSEHRDHLWAEALHLYRQGARWWPERAESSLLAAEQEERRQVDPWEQPIAAYVERRRGMGETVTAADILEHCLLRPVNEWTRHDEMRVADVLRALGWRKGPRCRVHGVRVRPYVAPETCQPDRDPGQEG